MRTMFQFDNKIQSLISSSFSPEKNHNKLFYVLSSPQHTVVNRVTYEMSNTTVL